MEIIGQIHASASLPHGNESDNVQHFRLLGRFRWGFRSSGTQHSVAGLVVPDISSWASQPLKMKIQRPFETSRHTKLLSQLRCPEQPKYQAQYSGWVAEQVKTCREVK